MEVITGYFVSRQQALEATEFLRQKGFKGEISVFGRNSEEEDIGKTDNIMSTDDILGMSSYGITLGFGGAPIAPVAFMPQGSGQLVVGGPIAGIVGGSLYSEANGILTSWGVPEKEGEEIKRVIESGNSVILVRSEESDKKFISDTLQYKGAQNIHK